LVSLRWSWKCGGVFVIRLLENVLVDIVLQLSRSGVGGGGGGGEEEEEERKEWVSFLRFLRKV
jgi:hypothetical protein